MDNPSYNPSSRSARVQKPKVIFELVHSVNPIVEVDDELRVYAKGAIKKGEELFGRMERDIGIRPNVLLLNWNLIKTTGNNEMCIR